MIDQLTAPTVAEVVAVKERDTVPPGEVFRFLSSTVVPSGVVLVIVKPVGAVMLADPSIWVLVVFRSVTVKSTDAFGLTHAGVMSAEYGLVVVAAVAPETSRPAKTIESAASTAIERRTDDPIRFPPHKTAVAAVAIGTGGERILS